MHFKQVTRKRRRLTKKMNIAKTNVIEISSSDDENTNTTSINQNQYTPTYAIPDEDIIEDSSTGCFII